jgi:hypothetical protein
MIKMPDFPDPNEERFKKLYKRIKKSENIGIVALIISIFALLIAIWK